MEGRITRQRKGERGDETTASGKKSGRSQLHLEPTKAAGDVWNAYLVDWEGLGAGVLGWSRGIRHSKCLHKRESSAEKDNSVIIYSPTCQSKPVRLCFFVGTQKQTDYAGCAFL